MKKPTGLTVSDLVSEIERDSPESASPLTHLTAAVLAAERLTDLGDGVVDHFVRGARGVGVSWAEIGRCLGVTKQAAQKRFVTERPDARARQADFLEQFEPDAGDALSFAQEEAVRLGHAYIGTEHLLLGVLRESDGVAAMVLRAAGVRLEDARALAERIVGRGKGSPHGMLPLTPRGKRTLELALRECRERLGDRPGSSDVLLGVLREGKGVGAQLVRRLVGDGYDADRLRGATLAALQS